MRLKAGMERLLCFVDKYLELIGAGSHPECEIDIVFNRDIAINESQAITDCAASKGIISDETIIKTIRGLRMLQKSLSA